MVQPDKPPPESNGPETPATVVPPVVKTWSSEQLLGAANEAVIIHGGQAYRLRLTQSGKLILTK